MRNWGLIRHLAERGHHIWLLTFDERANGAAKMPAVLHEVCQEVVALPPPARSWRSRLRTLVGSSLPDMAWRLWSPAFLEALKELLRRHRFDVVQVEGIELARYMLALIAWASGAVRWVFDDHNCEYLLQQRTFLADLPMPWRWHGAAYSLVQWRRLRSFERRAIRAADVTLCVSPHDRKALQRLDAQASLCLIPNGICLADYAGHWASLNSSTSPTVVFTGKMDFRPNVNAVWWFWRSVWPQVRQAHPQARLWVVGQKPSPRLDPLRADPSVTLTGEVEDTRPFIAQADVYVAPLLAGGGTRLKLLEAMAMHKAIVSTSLGCEGFDVVSGRELIIADTPAAFAGAVNALLGDPQRRQELGERAYRFVSNGWDWSAIVPRLEAVYASL